MFIVIDLFDTEYILVEFSTKTKKVAGNWLVPEKVFWLNCDCFYFMQHKSKMMPTEFGI